ncbi:MAG TPA: glycine--tRNA ligase subunit beta, partial [Thermoanaerobaculia bacterium]
MAEYLFELLTEEIPAWMHAAATATLHEKLSDFCASVAGQAGERTVAVHSSSRRIAFVLRNLPDRSEDQTRLVKGPPRTAAYKDGEPAPALLGFLKKQGAKLEDVITPEGQD